MSASEQNFYVEPQGTHTNYVTFLNLIINSKV